MKANLQKEGAEVESVKRATVRCGAYGRCELMWCPIRHRGVGDHQVEDVRSQKTDRSVLGKG